MPLKIFSFLFSKGQRHRYFEFTYPNLDSSSGIINIYSLRSKKLTGIIVTLINDRNQKFNYSIPEVSGRHEQSIELKHFLNTSSQPFEGSIKKIKVVFSEGAETFLQDENKFFYTR